MIISKTPLRISFVGGGSDLPNFYKKNIGAVISTAINKYIYITVNKKFDNKIRASYSRTELVDDASQIQHPLIRECLKKVGIHNGVEVASLSDIPSEGTGLGSSSSYTVGLLNALYAYKGVHVSAEKLAQDACEIEIDILGDPIGKQDQYIAAYGGFQFIKFMADGSVIVDPIIISPGLKNKLQSQMMLFYTNITRPAGQIMMKQSKQMKENDEKRGNVMSMVQLSFDMQRNLENGSLKGFGEILHKNWMLKRDITPGITSHEIDSWYELAKKHGAIGGKILGAGGGGFLLIYSKKKDKETIKKKLKMLQFFDFNFEPQGSRIIHVS